MRIQTVRLGWILPQTRLNVAGLIHQYVAAGKASGRTKFGRRHIHTETCSTIYAPATPVGKSAIAVVRISGPAVENVWRSKIRTARKTGSIDNLANWPPSPRKALLRQICDAQSGEKLDEGIVIYFPASSSLTGQDTLELHLHGSNAVLKAVLASLASLRSDRNVNIRPAEPGEFTRLAFDSGRMDLTETEGLRDLIDAETEMQRKLASQLAGGMAKQAFEEMRASIIIAMSVLEAVIDFGEDEGIGEADIAPARQRIQQLRNNISLYLAHGKQAEMMRTGARLAIFGAPNAGKSSLLNWLAQREASIVTAHPGTTRDIIELSLDFHGYPVIVSDTAGLRATTDEVEVIGVQRAQHNVKAADLRVCVVSLPEAMQSLAAGGNPLDPLTASLVDKDTIFVLNKADAVPDAKATWSNVPTSIAHQTGHPPNSVKISLLEQTGLQKISAALKNHLDSIFSDLTADNPLLITHDRHKYHLEECRSCLDAFLDMDIPTNLVDAAEELRYASAALGKVTGRVRVDDILDELFSSFCIGK